MKSAKIVLLLLLAVLLGSVSTSAQDATAKKMKIRVEFQPNQDFIAILVPEGVALTRGGNEFYQQTGFLTTLAESVAKERGRYGPLTRALMDTHMFRFVNVVERIEHPWQKRREILLEIAKRPSQVGRGTSITRLVEAVKTAIGTSLGVEVEEMLPRVVMPSEYTQDFYPKLITENTVRFRVEQVSSTLFTLHVENREVALTSREPAEFREGELYAFRTPLLVHMLIQEVGGGGLIRKIRLSQRSIELSLSRPLRDPEEVKTFLEDVRGKINTLLSCEFS